MLKHRIRRTNIYNIISPCSWIEYSFKYTSMLIFVFFLKFTIYFLWIK
nr:MAG TPA: hypothetical protein [Bacteriophage sp.]